MENTKFANFSSYVTVEMNERSVLLDGHFPPLMISRFLFIFVESRESFESRVRRGFKGYITGRWDFNPGQERVEIPFDGV